MPADVITCPQCQAALNGAVRAPAGWDLKCPRCGCTFPVPARVAGGMTAAPSGAGGRAEDQRRWDDPAPEPWPPHRRPLRQRRGRRRTWLFVGAWALLLLAGIGVGLALWWYSTQNNPREMIIGVWESTDQPSVGTVEFKRDGAFIFRSANGPVVVGKYRLLDETTLEVEIPNQGRPVGWQLPRLQRFGQIGPPDIPETVKGTGTIVKLTRTELVTNNPVDGVRHFKRAE